VKFMIVTPISHLFKNSIIASTLIKYSDWLEVRDNNVNYENAGGFYHSELNILSKWNEKELRHLKRIHKDNSPTQVSFHLSNRYQRTTITINECGSVFKGLGSPMTKREMKDNVKRNLKQAKEIFVNCVCFSVENINHLLTDAYDVITDASFISEIVVENGLSFVLDIAHAVITCANLKLDFIDYVKALPLSSTVQLHISRAKLVDGVGRDSHESLEEKEWALLKNWLRVSPWIKYVTVEYYKDVGLLIKHLKKLKEMQNG